MPRSRVSCARLGRILAVEQREFALHRGDRVGRMGAPDALRPRFRTSRESGPCPARPAGLIAPTVSSTGTAGSTRCW